MIEIATELKNNAEKLVYEIGQGVDHKILHTIALQILMKSVDLQRQLEMLNNSEGLKKKAKSAEISDVQEIQKVKNRLKLWANRPDQKNHQILKKWLELSNDQQTAVKEEDFAQAASNSGINKFYDNFIQMKIIADKNHGKVFDVNNGYVTLWKPIEDAVYEFKSKVMSQ